MKTLYISDLDGTLLNRNAEITPYTMEVINNFTKRGGYFTVATARSLDTVLHILRDVKLNIPVILLNGVSIYDTVKGQTERIVSIPRPSLDGLFQTLTEFNMTGFAYTYENDDIAHYYENLDSEHRREFHDDRSGRFGRVYKKVTSFTELSNHEVVYFSTCDDYALLKPIYEKIQSDPLLHVEFYQDIYHECFWYMEVCSTYASKYNAAKFLQEKYVFERIISFGDNMNDLPLFRASDECYAVGNAKSEVKEKATATIGDNENDGVAEWLAVNVLG
ncbi:MAG: HAD family hydrolase [Lachnospiraceae bacterium]|jgi:Cof subfamily protein (haloacid dehalogenase superfamily)|nr:HAD family hydrolase [Lachnospiraceae bacterium]